MKVDIVTKMPTKTSYVDARSFKVIVEFDTNRTGIYDFLSVNNRNFGDISRALSVGVDPWVDRGHFPYFLKWTGQ